MIGSNNTKQQGKPQLAPLGAIDFQSRLGATGANDVHCLCLLLKTQPFQCLKRCYMSKHMFLQRSCTCKTPNRQSMVLLTLYDNVSTSFEVPSLKQCHRDGVEIQVHPMLKLLLKLSLSQHLSADITRKDAEEVIFCKALQKRKLQE